MSLTVVGSIAFDAVKTPFGERERMPVEVIHAFGVLKLAAARVNARLGLLAPDIAAALEADPVADTDPAVPPPCGPQHDRVPDFAAG